jgi:hypothetical protein
LNAIASVFGALIGVIGLLALLLMGSWLAWQVRGLCLASRVRRTWPAGKVGIIAYTNNRKWASHVEERLLPRLASKTIVVDRSDAQWKSRFPLEHAVIRHWGGRREYNPIVIAFPSTGAPRVFRLYEAFQETRRGDRADLEKQTALILEAFDSYVA